MMIILTIDLLQTDCSDGTRIIAPFYKFTNRSYGANFIVPVYFLQTGCSDGIKDHYARTLVKFIRTLNVK
ncbi:MAG: hypothetical protein M3139_09225 [Bacteroidota bacterium]|nr:hypothetical protein [Bacteroidota bacterium]